MTRVNESSAELHESGKASRAEVPPGPKKHRGREPAGDTLHERYASLGDDLLVGRFRSTPGADGKLLLSNLATARMHGYDSVDEIRGVPMRSFYWDPAAREAFSNKLLEQGHVEHEEVRLKRKDGTPFWGRITARVVRDSAGEVAHFEGIIQDVTAQKEVEEAYRTLVDESLQAMMILQGREVLFVNARAAELIGYSEEEMYSLTLEQMRKLVHPEDLPLIAKRYMARVAGMPVPDRYTARCIRRDGSTLWLEVHAKAITYRGRPAVQATAVDITDRIETEKKLEQTLNELESRVEQRTAELRRANEQLQHEVGERKRAEAALRASEAQYRTTLDSMGDVIHLTDLQHRVLLGNTSFHRWMEKLHPGLDPIGKSIFELFPFIPPRAKTEYARVVQTRKTLVTEEEVTVDGRTHFTETRKIPVLQDGEVVRVVTTVRDITDRREAEEQLHLLTKAVEQAAEGIAVADLKGNIQYINSAFAGAHGYRSEELRGKNLSLLHTPEQMPRVAAANRMLMEQGSFEGEVWHAHRNGKTFPTLMHNSLLRDEQGEPIGLIGTLRDITDRKRAEELLRLQRDLGLAVASTSSLDKALRLLVECAMSLEGIDGGGIYMVDPETGDMQLSCSQGLSERFTAAVGHYDADSAQCRLVRLGEARYMASERFQSSTREVRDEEGLRAIGMIPIRHGSDIVASLNIASKTRAHLPPATRHSLEAIASQVGTVLARVRAEQALQQSEAHFRSLIENASDLILLLSREGTVRYQSPSLEHVLGYAPGELLGKNIFEYLHADDVLRVVDRFERGNEKPGHVETVELRFRDRTGSWRYLEATGTNLLDHPAVRAVVINARDVTERRSAEEMRMVFGRSIEQSNDAVLITDGERRITFTNRAAQALYGYSAEEMLHEDPQELLKLHPARTEQIWSDLRRSRKWSGTLDVWNRDGESFRTSATLMMIPDEQDQPIASVWFSRDIRETHRLESIQHIAEAAAGAGPSDSEAIRRIMDHLPELIGVDRWGIYVYNASTDALEARYYSESGRALAEAMPSIPASAPVSSCVLHDGEIFFTRDASGDERFTRNPAFRGGLSRPGGPTMGATCVLPLRCGGQIIGAFYVSDQRVRMFTPEEWSALKTLASHVGMLLGRSTETTGVTPPSHQRSQVTDQVSVVARSEAMQLVLKSAERIAVTNLPVLILGATGAGKGHLAKYVHGISPRANGPFLSVNCACLDGELILSELFGHERGAFTGAVRQQKGCFELANGGTLLLDEVVELPLSAQAKLLQLVETQQFRRLGGQQTITTDIRIICTTNADVRECVQQGKLRQDLYYRLNTAEIVIPPLAERPQDIPDLANAYLRTQALLSGQPPCTITDGAMARLCEYHWPGNVRELQNVLSLAMSHGGRVIGTRDLRFSPTVPPVPSRADAGRVAGEREEILEALRRNRWNRSQAAEELGIHRNTLRNRMRKYDITE